MLSWSSDMKKFQFFQENKYKDIVNIQNIDEEEIDNIEKKGDNSNIIKNKQEIDTININNISISGPREMHTINGLLFINGKLIHEKDGKMIRENLIMKILDNKIIDLYRIFNGVYYSFELKIFENKPYFIVIGGNFNEFMIDSKMELFMITSIKIYDASYFIFNKNSKFPPQNLSNLKEEPYPQILIKNIKLIKRLSDEKIMCELDEHSMEGYESIQNINSFAINSEFTHAAIGLDKGDIILLYGYPNLIECNSNAIKMVILPKINVSLKGHVTNLFFTQINSFNNSKRILYASTSKIIYYYEWNYKLNKSNIYFFNEEEEENNIKLKTLNPGGPGGYSGCIDIKKNHLLLGSSNDDFICEFDNLEISKTWFFEGKKTNIYYFKDYLLFAVSGENYSTLQVYDKRNSFFIYYKNSRKKIIGLCCDSNNIYVFYEKNQNYKYILKLTEKSFKEKMQIIFNKNFFDVAVTYAENYNLDKSKIANLSRIYAEDEYKKGNYKISIQQYIKTIGFYQPNYIIQKFNDFQKLNYLIIYLEKLLDYYENKAKAKEEYKAYLLLLLNCYIMNNNIADFKKYIQKISRHLSKELSEKIIDICIEIKEIDFGLKYAKQKKLYIKYIETLFKLNRKEDALHFIRFLTNIDKGGKPSINNEKIDPIISHYETHQISRSSRNYSVRPTNMLPCKEMQAVFNKFISYFMDDNSNNNDNENSLSNQFFEIFMSFIYKDYQIIEEKDMNILVHNFLYYDKYLIMIFDKLIKYPIEFDQKILHRRIELLLEEINNTNEEKEKERLKKKVTDILIKPKYKNTYDFDYLMFLFKTYEFNEGIEFISKEKKNFQDILFIIFNNKEYNKLSNIFNRNSNKNRILWEIGLELFLEEFKKIKDKEELYFSLKTSFQEFLSKISDYDIIPPMDILNKINLANDSISFDLVKNFYIGLIDKESTSLVNNIIKSKEYEANMKEIDEEMKNIKEKPVNFKISKCAKCNLFIDFPAIFFYCGHYFHSLCFYTNAKDITQIHCYKCYNNEKQIDIKNIENEKIFKIINNEEGLERELSIQKNHIDFIHILYSKGLFKYMNKSNKK